MIFFEFSKCANIVSIVFNFFYNKLFRYGSKYAQIKTFVSFYWNSSGLLLTFRSFRVFELFYT